MCGYGGNGFQFLSFFSTKQWFILNGICGWYLRIYFCIFFRGYNSNYNAMIKVVSKYMYIEPETMKNRINYVQN